MESVRRRLAAAEDAVRQSCSQLSVVPGAFLHRCTSLQHVLNNTPDYFFFWVLRESLGMKWNKTCICLV